MEENQNAFVHDTINLDEIKHMLNGHSTPKEPVADAQAQAASEDHESGESKTPKNSAYEFYMTVRDIINILALITIVFVFVVRLVGVDGDSMLPTLHDRDYLLLESNFLYGPERVENGDIVVLNVPYYKDKGPIVKRVIATEGQTVDIDFEEGLVYVDGELLEEAYIKEPTYLSWGEDDGLEYPATVPEDCIFVLGDNRNDSMDSRFAEIGMVDQECILGKVLFILLPGQTRDDYGNVTEDRDWGRIGIVS